MSRSSHMDAVLAVRFEPLRVDQLKVAASLSGVTVSAFVRQAAQVAASEVLLRDLAGKQEPEAVGS